MKKKVYGLTIAFALLFSAAAGSLLVNSAAGIIPVQEMPTITVNRDFFLISASSPFPPIQEPPAIWINSDGSITPETGWIGRDGNVYTLTADIEGYVIGIARSNIVFDGAGHTIYVPPPDPGYRYARAGLNLFCVTNVTVKNLEVSGVSLYNGIQLYYSYNCLLTGVKTFNVHYSDLPKTVSRVEILGDFNTVTESTIRLDVQGSNNLFMKNNVHKLYVWSVGSNNRFYLNNFFLTDLPGIRTTNFWDNGSVGNYWGDHYLTKYPNASEIGNTGIGDTPYIIERSILPSLDDPDAENVDYYPLVYPYDIEKDVIAFPEPESQPEPESFSTALVASISTLMIVGVVAGFFYYQKRRSKV